MLSFERIPMFSQEKTAVSLLDILNKLPGRELSWQLYEFIGVGIPPTNYTMPSFEEHLLSLSYGYNMSWQELIHFASGLEQTWSCFIVGASADKQISWDDLKRNNFEKCTFVVEALDSSYWNIGQAGI